MSILKYYKVDSDGKIKRLRRECPSPECGAGIFVRFLCHFPATSSHAKSLVDGFPQGSSILWQVPIDLHFPTWHQASRHVNVCRTGVFSTRQFLYVLLGCMSKQEINMSSSSCVLEARLLFAQFTGCSSVICYCCDVL
jgi:ribosomal protein S27AE